MDKASFYNSLEAILAASNTTDSQALSAVLGEAIAVIEKVKNLVEEQDESIRRGDRNIKRKLTRRERNTEDSTAEDERKRRSPRREGTEIGYGRW